MTGNDRAPKCEEFRERFVLLWDDEGERAERDRILAHIESCDECAAEWEAFRMTAENLRAVDAEPAEAERRAILEAAAPILEELRRRPEGARPASRQTRPLRRLLRYALTAAAAAILFFLVQTLSGPEREGLRSMDVVHYYDTGGMPPLLGGADFSVPR
ncbi:MAG: zf-HC2 domain-containing protein [Candidatus Eisenbacteria bacterium]